MPLSDIALCSRALIRLGSAPIDSFDDGTAESEIAAALYAPVRDALLSAYPWSFAVNQFSLDRLDAPPLADYQSAFQLPVDFLRAISAGAGGRGRGLNYRIAQGALHANADSVVLTYIFRPDESEFPPYFESILVSKLSAEFCIPVTENTTRAQALYNMAELDIQRGRQIDSQQQSPKQLDDFTLITARD